MKKQRLYGVASAVVAFATLVAGASIASAQTSTSTFGHHGHDNGHGNDYNNYGHNNNGSNNNNWSDNHDHRGNHDNHGHTFWQSGNNLYFHYGGQQYYGAEMVYAGRAFKVGPNSFTLNINGTPYPVYYATGFQALNHRGGVFGSTGVLPGDYVRVDGVFLNGVIYARYVRDLSR